MGKQRDQDNSPDATGEISAMTEDEAYKELAKNLIDAINAPRLPDSFFLPRQLSFDFMQEKENKTLPSQTCD